MLSWWPSLLLQCWWTNTRLYIISFLLYRQSAQWPEVTWPLTSRLWIKPELETSFAQPQPITVWVFFCQKVHNFPPVFIYFTLWIWTEESKGGTFVWLELRFISGRSKVTEPFSALWGFFIIIFSDIVTEPKLRLCFFAEAKTLFGSDHTAVPPRSPP